MKKLALRLLLGMFSFLIAIAIVVQFRFSTQMSKQYELPPISLGSAVANADIELGKRIYHVRNGCVECHGVDLSGALIMDNGPMGTIYGGNISPHLLASWSDEDIARAIRYGIHKSGRSLRFMPSFDFEGLSLEDTAALIAYMRSVPAVKKENHENSFGIAAKALSAFGKMPIMFPAAVIDLKKPFGAKPAEADSAEFGQYLAHSCTGCHGAELRGGKIPGGDPSWPEASSIRLGADKTWTRDNFFRAIKTGVSPRTSQPIRPPMPVALLQQMNEMEISALWKYLSALQ